MVGVGNLEVYSPQKDFVFAIVGEWKGAGSPQAYAYSLCTFLVKIDPTYKHRLDHHTSTFLTLGMQCYANTCSCSHFTY